MTKIENWLRGLTGECQKTETMLMNYDQFRTAFLEAIKESRLPIVGIPHVRRL